MSGRSSAAVGRSFLKLGTGEALARLVAFFATVYLARLLGPDVYGMIVLATATLLYVTCVSDCGVEMLGVHDVARDPAQLPSLVPAYLGARLLVAGTLVVLLAGVGLLVLPQPEGAVLAAYAFLLLPVAVGTRWVQLGLERGGSAALARVLTEAVAALLIVALVRGPGDLMRAPLAQILGESAGAFLLFRWLPGGAARLRPVLRLEVVRGLFRRSWPIVAHLLLGLLIFNSDFFFLRIYRDSATVGQYAVAYTLVSFFLNLGGSYEMSLLPTITRLGDQPAEQRSLFGSAMAQAFAGAFPIALGGCLLAGPLVTLVFGGDYVRSGAPLSILIWCVPVALFRNVAQTALIAHGRQDRMLRTTAWTAGINLLLNATVIPRWGMAGAAFATLATELVRTILALRYCLRLGMPPAPLARFWRALAAGGLMALALELGDFGAVPLSVAVGGSVYLLALYLTGGIRLRRGALPELTV